MICYWLDIVLRPGSRVLGRAGLGGWLGLKCSLVWGGGARGGGGDLPHPPFPSPPKAEPSSPIGIVQCYIIVLLYYYNIISS